MLSVHKARQKIVLKKKRSGKHRGKKIGHYDVLKKCN